METIRPNGRIDMQKDTFEKIAKLSANVPPCKFSDEYLSARLLVFIHQRLAYTWLGGWRTVADPGHRFIGGRILNKYIYIYICIYIYIYTYIRLYIYNYVCKNKNVYLDKNMIYSTSNQKRLAPASSKFFSRFRTRDFLEVLRRCKRGPKFFILGDWLWLSSAIIKTGILMAVRTLS